VSTAEIVVIVGGLVFGYLVVAALMKPRRQAPPAAAAPPEAPPPGWPAVLGVPADASYDDIRAAYRRLMSEYHPDKVAGLGVELRELASRKATEINAAYDAALAERGAAR
jgi:DnaJ like chaperone protein